MDEAQALEAFTNVVGLLTERPYDFSLHLQHIRMAESIPGMEAEAQAALETFNTFYAAGDEAWIPLIEAKEKELDLKSAADVRQLLELYERAEADYLSIPILKRHLEFVMERHAAYTEGEAKPEELEELFSTEWTRLTMTDIVNKGVGHLAQSHVLWDQLRDWELGILEAASPSEKPALAEQVQMLLLDRLRQPHSNSDATFQVYSTFTTNYKPSDQYEALMVAASKMKSHAVRGFEHREPFENELVNSGNSLESYSRYTGHERRAKNVDLLLMSAVHERAIAEAAKRHFNEEPNAETALRSFWTGYLDALRLSDVDEAVQLNVVRRAVRSVPGSGEVWARYIRLLERIDTESVDVGEETIQVIYAKAFDMKLLQNDPEQIIPVTLARAGYEKRRIEAETSDDETLPTLIGVLENGIEMVRAASSAGDPRLRLERYLSEVYRIAEVVESAVSVWQLAAKHYKSSYLVWTLYTEALIKAEQYDEARKTYSDICMKNIDWPEAIWEAWLGFEHLHGTTEQVEACMDKIEKAQYQVNIRRAKEAEKAAMQQMQMAAEQAAASILVSEVPVPDVGNEDAMEVDTTTAGERGTKRHAEDDLSLDGQKRVRKDKPLPLQRDRENSTVFVSDLADGVEDKDLIDLFKDCGKIREVKITHLPNSNVATVEFFDRDSVPAALTKDKKRIQGNEISVHLAWQSTLYITNFPETADDGYIRNLFGKYGTIFDVRWPSKKFKNTRRFCYLQYTSPDAAQRSLELHQRELEPGLQLNVFISNPERKKERTDQDANDREIYVTGLNKSTTKTDLENLFRQYGSVKEVRLATEENGVSKGYAFVEFEDVKDAHAALEANNQELRNRRIAVTFADSRAKARNAKFNKDTGLGRKAEMKSRTLRIRNLPPGTQEGLLQQVIEKVAEVKRLEVFTDLNEAVVEFTGAAEAGKLLLRTEPFVFNGNELKFSEEAMSNHSTRTGVTAGFVPRVAVSRPKAGLGQKRKPVAPIFQGAQATGSQTQSSKTTASSGGKGQDDFRKMLGGK
ncbi:rna-binding protein prp24 [Moniliophthora roreri]|uniref:U4/U6 snRNA-associated-splicing factor PRP24 n=1 Tax=Moniliophthora roreri TaxID=221103 RepID=A0A0W0G7P8_MONRR|nr:rna-binding protein prp24 [Moniliophthora roreri]